MGELKIVEITDIKTLNNLFKDLKRNSENINSKVNHVNGEFDLEYIQGQTVKQLNCQRVKQSTSQLVSQIVN